VPSRNGTTYRVVLTVPRNYNSASPPPLGVIWHALTSSPEETRALTDIDVQAEQRGWVMVYPAAPDQQWNGGTCCFQTARDDVAFARDLVTFVESKVCVDRKRVYTAGFSNGGFMSYRLACEAADLFAASAPIAGAFAYTNGASCKPSRPIPLYAINGTVDPLVTYNGGLFPSAPNSFKWMADADKCTGSPVVTKTVGAWSCQTYQQCAAGVEVTLCTVNGMGHCMPGMKTESPTNCLTRLIPLGMPNNDLNGVKVAADFLSQWSLP